LREDATRATAERHHQRASWRDPLLVFVLALIVRTLAALPQEQPHYFDAYYYHDVAENLYVGRGFVEDFIWNYLDAPSTVTHPSNLYWTPLSSILAWLSFSVFGSSYRAAQLPFILLSSLPPLLAYCLSYHIGGKREHAWLAAILTVFAPFYLKYWASPDNFAPFAVTAGLSLVTMYLVEARRQGRYALFTGLLIGLSHLSRADGVLLWMAFVAVLVLAVVRRDRSSSDDPDPRAPASRRAVVGSCLIWLLLGIAGYLMVMTPWFWRNWRIIGAPLSSAGTKTLFLRTYADLFSYSAELTWRSYLNWGWAAILRSKASAGAHNLTVLVGALQFHLAPLAIIGLWQLRRRREYVPFYVYAAILYLAMTLLFTFPSTHASMLHSTGALLPFLFAAALPGIDAAVVWIALRRRTWHPRTAQRVFRVGLTAVFVAISVFNYCQAVFLSLDPLGVEPLWNRANTGYLAVSSWLEENSPAEPLVMVVDPPAYHYFTHRPAIVIPNEDLPGIVSVAHRYDADYLILEQDHVASLDPLYRRENTYPALQLQHTIVDDGGQSIQVYAVRR
jgi:hypothetical protein